MFLIYILICLFFILLYKQTKHLNISLIITLLTLIICQSFSTTEIVNDVIALLSEVVISRSLLLLVVVLILINCIIELILFIGQHHIIEDYISQKSVFVQKTYVHVISALSTNVNFRNSELVGKYNNIFDTSSFLMSTLLLLSIPFLMLFFYFSPTLISIGNFTFVVLALILTNFFAIFWFVKRIIDFRFNKDHEYDYHTDLLVQEDMAVKPINQSVLFKNFFIRTTIFTILISAIILIFEINILVGVLCLLLIIFIDLFISIEHFSYKTKLIREKDIYLRLASAIKKMARNLITFVVGMLFITEASDMLLTNTFYDINKLLVIFIIFICVSLIATYYTSSYVTGLIITIPILNVLMQHFPFFDEYFIFIFLIQGAIIFIYFLSIMHINFKNRALILELLYMAVSGGLAYILLFLTSSYLLALLSLIVTLSFYYLRAKRSR